MRSFIVTFIVIEVWRDDKQAKSLTFNELFIVTPFKGI